MHDAKVKFGALTLTASVKLTIAQESECVYGWNELDEAVSYLSLLIDFEDYGDSGWYGHKKIMAGSDIIINSPELNDNTG